MRASRHSSPRWVHSVTSRTKTPPEGLIEHTSPSGRDSKGAIYEPEWNSKANGACQHRPRLGPLARAAPPRGVEWARRNKSHAYPGEAEQANVGNSPAEGSSGKGSFDSTVSPSPARDDEVRRAAYEAFLRRNGGPGDEKATGLRPKPRWPKRTTHRKEFLALQCKSRNSAERFPSSAPLYRRTSRPSAAALSPFSALRSIQP